MAMFNSYVKLPEGILNDLDTTANQVAFDTLSSAHLWLSGS